MERNYTESAVYRFPPEIVQMIGRENPSTYRALASSSRRVGNILQPVTQALCDSPPSFNEIRRYIQTDRPRSLSFIWLKSPITIFNVLLDTPDEANLTYRNYSGRIFSTLQQSVHPLEETISLIPWHLQQGYQLDLISTFKILAKRLNCQRQSPNYAYEQVWQLFIERINQILLLERLSTRLFELLEPIFDDIQEIFELDYPSYDDWEDLWFATGTDRRDKFNAILTLMTKEVQEKLAQGPTTDVTASSPMRPPSPLLM